MKIKNNDIKIKGKKRLKFRHIYGLIMIVITGIFAFIVLDLLVLQPSNIDGLVLGIRMDEFEPLENSWLRNTEIYGSSLEYVESVEMFWNSGPVVYLIVNIEQDSSRSNGRRAANDIVEHFIETSNSVALMYDIQVVLMRENPEFDSLSDLATANEEALNVHVMEFYYDLVERMVAWAEEYPSEFNISRAEENIGVFSNFITELTGEDGVRILRSRLSALEAVAEGESEEQMPRLPLNLRQIPQSDITRFPNWGTWDNNRNRIIWSP